MIAVIPATVKEGGTALSGREESDILALRGAGAPLPVTPLDYRLRLRVVSNTLTVRGRIEIGMRFRCCRCGEEFEAPVVDNGFESFREYEDSSALVDLTADVREAILLAFPNYPVCGSGCRGMCSRCGADLNRELCRCQKMRPDDRWGELGKLKL